MGVQNFVGGASDGEVGVAAMRYTNPLTKSFGFQKAWFFLEEDIQHVIVSNITSTSNVTVVSVLDQRRHIGPVQFDNTTSDTVTLWHGGVGYRVPNPQGSFSVRQSVEEKTGNWSSIGTSTKPPTTVDLFSASIEHHSLDVPLEYTAYPGTDEESFARKQRQLQLFTVRNDADVSAIYDKSHATAFLVFWSPAGGTVKFDHHDGSDNPFTISTTSSGVVIFKQWSGNITVADPSQSIASIELTIEMEIAWPDHKTFRFELPTSGEAGGSVTQNLYAP